MAVYLRELCDTDGVSGGEGAVREFIAGKIVPHADGIFTDTIGNLVAFKKGKSSEKKLMLSAHTDEVGFIISKITEKGFLEFKTVGGIDPRVIISKRVRIGKNKVNGVIAMKAVHLQSTSERSSVPKVRELYIDIGARSADEAKKKVSLGDYVAFVTEYEQIGSRIKAKAIDDRAGCAILMDLIEQTPAYDTYFCFTTQEEVGLRGARLCAARIKPDAALVIEATTCSDTAGVEQHSAVTLLGGGAAISFADRTTIVPEDYCRALFELAAEHKIKVQYKAAVSGGNDAGAIHLAVGGIKTASVSVPARYIHSPASVADIGDIEAVRALAGAFLANADKIII